MQLAALAISSNKRDMGQDNIRSLNTDTNISIFSKVYNITKAIITICFSHNFVP
jgi:hypothetical protein